MDCTHHWQIESPSGATVRGVCKRCGAERLVPTSSDADVWYDVGAGLTRGHQTTGTATARRTAGPASSPQ